MSRMADTDMLHFADAVTALLNDYTTEVQEAVNAAVQDTSKSLVKDLKARSPVRTGKYKSGWKAKIERSRSSGIERTTAIVYNQAKPGLVHLLEHGHQRRDGGREPGTPHVAPAKEAAEVFFAKRIEEELR